MKLKVKGERVMKAVCRWMFVIASHIQLQAVVLINSNRLTNGLDLLQRLELI